MDTIDGMQTVVAVVETGSFTAASERLGLSKALVSKYVGQMERILGTRLFNRSTRRLSLTEAGENYYERVLPLLDEFAELQDSVRGEQNEPTGRLKISMPVSFGEMFLAPLLPTFLQRYPQLKIDLQLTYRRIDMLEEGVDLVIRIGSVDDSNLIAKQINRFPLTLCASPAYLEQHGCPTTPEQLAEHTCIVDSNFRVGHHWPLTTPAGEQRTVEVNSRISVNSPRAVKEIAKAGGGIAFSPRYIVREYLESGALVEVMTDHKSMSFDMYAIYPHRRYLSRKVRCFIEFMQEQFAAL